MVVALRNTGYEAPKAIGVGFGAATAPRQALRSLPTTQAMPKGGYNHSNLRAEHANSNISQNRDSQNGKKSSVVTCNTVTAPRYHAPLMTVPPAYSCALSTTITTRETPTPTKDSRHLGGFNKVLQLQNPYTGPRVFPQSIPNVHASPKKPALKKRKVSQTHPSLKIVRHQPPVIERIIGKASNLITEKTFQYLDILEERQRKLTYKNRISECLVNLRAASERSASLRDLEATGQRSRSNSLREVVGDVGLALFSPLDLDACAPLHNVRRETTDAHAAPAQYEKAGEYPIDMMPELQNVLAYTPRLLTPRKIQQLMNHLPATVLTMTCRRLFSLNRDGDSFLTMLDRCHSFVHTILVIETTEGHFLGGYASSPWDKQGVTTRSFYGDGQTFLFASHPDEMDGSLKTQEDEKIYVYPWTGQNNYCQVCDPDEGQVAMGGGGSFGLIVQDNFSRGTTGRCTTFGNPALIPALGSSGSTFEIVDFEMYGFVSMAETLAPHATEIGKPVSSILGPDFPFVDGL